MSDDPRPVRFPLLEISGLRKAFGATVALAGLDLAIARGEILALMGANGAVKSTLVSILRGAARVDAGAVRLDGRPFGPHPIRAASRKYSTCSCRVRATAGRPT